VSTQSQSNANRIHIDALILKGGGVKGLAFAGAVRELQENFDFDTFVGTSAGAVAAALLAAGASGARLEEKLRRKPFRDFLDGNMWTAFFDILFNGGIHPGLTLTNWIRRELFELLGRSNEVYMKDLPKRAVIYASQRDRGPVTFDKIGAHDDSTVHAAVRCSLSIPYFFQPQRLDHNWVYDGGLLNNFPLEIFLDQERLRCPDKHPSFIALYLGSARPPDLKGGRQLSGLLSIWIDRNDRDVIERYRSNTIIIDTEPIGTIDFNLGDEEKDFLVIAGRASALEVLRSRDLLDEARLQSVEPMRAEAERLRAVIEGKRKRRKSVWRQFLARTLAGVGIVFAVLAATISLESIINSAPPDPLKSLESLSTYLRR
jgi:Patatin-like phospholipase